MRAAGRAGGILCILSTPPRGSRPGSRTRLGAPRHPEGACPGDGRGDRGSPRSPRAPHARPTAPCSERPCSREARSLDSGSRDPRCLWSTTPRRTGKRWVPEALRLGHALYGSTVPPRTYAVPRGGRATAQQEDLHELLGTEPPEGRPVPQVRLQGPTRQVPRAFGEDPVADQRAAGRRAAARSSRSR